MTMNREEAAKKGKRVVLVGCGNIGSHVVPHLGRMRGVTAVTLIDRDEYEASNLAGQDIAPEDVGSAKAVAQARRLRRINPALCVEAIVDAVENVPLGALRGDVVATGLDSRRARQVVNERAWLLGVPWIDAGVQAEGSLAQVAVYVPGGGRPCIECGWTERDYALLEQTYPCGVVREAPGVAGAPGVSREAPGAARVSGEPPPTGAPSSLGALAASLLAIECERLICGAAGGTAGGTAGGAAGGAAGGYAILIDAAHHHYYAAQLVHNPDCRMPAHHAAPVRVTGTRAPNAALTTLFDRRGVQPAAGTAAEPAPDRYGRVSVVGGSFVTALTCPACADRRAVLGLKISIENRPAVRCRACGAATVAAGFDTRDEIDASALPPETLRRSLEDVGVRPGDIVRVTPANGEPFDLEIRGPRKTAQETGRRAR